MRPEPKKSPFRGIANALAADWVKGGILALVPTAAAAVTGVSAYMRAVPVWEIVTATALTFAAVITVIRGFVEVSWRIRVKGRLVSAGAQCVVHQQNNGTIDAIGLGLNLFNQSSRTIQYEILDASQVIDGRVSQTQSPHPVPVLLSPNSSLQYRAALVHIPTQKAGSILNYNYKVKMRYGEPGDMRYEVEFRFKGSYRFKSKSEFGVFEAFVD